MKKVLLILLLCLIITPAFGQLKPMLGHQIDISHLQSDFVGAWFFLEGSGNKVFDLSGNGNTGTEQVDAIWQPGKFGTCRYFSGDDYIEINGVVNHINCTTGAISVWVKFTDVVDLSDNAVHSLVEIGDDSSNTVLIAVRKIGNNTIVMRYRVGGTNYEAVISDISDFINWHHLVGVWDAVNVYIYDNGVLINTTNRTVGGDISGGLLDQSVIGTRVYSTPSTFFEGLIDVPSIYNRALSPSEIALLYNDPFCMFTKDNVALMITEAAAPPSVVPTLYYYSKLAPLPLILFGVYCYWFGKERKCVA